MRGLYPYISIIIIIVSFFCCGEGDQGNIARTSYRQGEILVQFKSGVDDLRKEEIHAASSVRAMKLSHLGRVERLVLPSDLSVEDAIRLYRQYPDVEFAEPNYVVRAAFVPNDPRFSEQWHLNNVGQIVKGVVGTPGVDIKAAGAWDTTRGDPTVTVAVIDSGIDASHPDVAGNLVPGYDFIDRDGDPEDLNGHGTHVAGIIGAVMDNAEGITGVAGHCRIMPLRVLDGNGEGTIADVIAAIDFAAERNVRIVNMSFAGSDYSRVLFDAMKAHPDMLFIAAAGNDGRSASGGNSDVTPLYPAGFDLPNIISVAATDQHDNLASFSNFGRASVDLAAPGTDIVSAIPSFVTGVVFQGAYTVIYLAFGFEGINGEMSRRAVMERVVNTSRVTAADTVLIVDDDGGDSYEAYYVDALRSLGVAFDVYRVPADRDGPDAATLKTYPLIIWFTGDAYRNTLTASDQINLRSYLDGGGELFISGQEIGFDIGESSFYRTYLHARYVTDNANGKVFTGSNAFAGLSVDVSHSGGDGASNQFFVDAIRPEGGATAFSILYRDAYEFLDGTSMSTAIVSGVSALVASHYRRFSGLEVKSVVLASVDRVSALGGKVLTGGRLNAERAVTALLPPRDLRAIPQENGRVLLSWVDSSTAEEGFSIERQRSGDQFRTIATVPAGVTTLTDNGPQSGTFTYRVKGYIGQSSSLYSNEVTVTIEDGVKSGSGGGGCALARPRESWNPVADIVVLVLPVIVVWITRKYLERR